jgi:twitching motility protein PilT
MDQHRRSDCGHPFAFGREGLGQDDDHGNRGSLHERGKLGEPVGIQVAELDDDCDWRRLALPDPGGLLDRPPGEGLVATEPDGDLQDAQGPFVDGNDDHRRGTWLLPGLHAPECTVTGNVDDQIEQLLRTVAELGGSDAIFAPGAPPSARVRGELVRIGDRPLTDDETEELAHRLAGTRWGELVARRQLDFSFSFGERARVRANLFYQRGTLAGALRLIPYDIPSLEELRAPKICVDMTTRPNGLVIVTGPTGSGKSTTLAAMIDRINRERPLHIITIEDPIEYVHRHKRSVVVQREVGSDAPDFASALRAALRESPDVILVGEMRDLETIAATLTLAETGHLVFATLHTNDTAQAIDRIVDVFPPQQQHQVQIQLSQALLGVIHQRLLPRADGAGRVAAFEVMLGTAAVRNLIRDGKPNQLRNVLATGAAQGMQTLEADLRTLEHAGIITRSAALAESSHPTEID